MLRWYVNGFGWEFWTSLRSAKYADEGYGTNAQLLYSGIGRSLRLPDIVTTNLLADYEYFERTHRHGEDGCPEPYIFGTPNDCQDRWKKRYLDLFIGNGSEPEQVPRPPLPVSISTDGEAVVLIIVLALDFALINTEFLRWLCLRGICGGDVYGDVFRVAWQIVAGSMHLGAAASLTAKAVRVMAYLDAVDARATFFSGGPVLYPDIGGRLQLVLWSGVGAKAFSLVIVTWRWYDRWRLREREGRQTSPSTADGRRPDDDGWRPTDRTRWS